MLIYRSSQGDFVGNPFVIGTTDKVEYLPVYAAFSKNYRSHNYGENLLDNVVGDVYLYHKPSEDKQRYRFPRCTKYDDLFTYLTKRTDNVIFEFKVNDVYHEIICTQGYLVDSDGNILLILCTKSFDIFKDTRTYELKSENLKLFVSTRLINNPIYKNLYKKLQNDYIQECYEKDVEVVFTTSNNIKKRVFENSFEVSFNNLTELNDHLKSGVGNNLFFDEDAYIESFEPEQEDEVLFTLDGEEEVIAEDSDYEELPF